MNLLEQHLRNRGIRIESFSVHTGELARKGEDRKGRRWTPECASALKHFQHAFLANTPFLTVPKDPKELRDLRHALGALGMKCVLVDGRLAVSENWPVRVYALALHPAVMTSWEDWGRRIANDCDSFDEHGRVAPRVASDTAP